MKPRATFLLAVTFLGAGGCGTRTLQDLSNATPPLAVYEADEKTCAAAEHGDPEQAVRANGAGEQTVVAEIFFADECTGLGGQYILAHALEGSRGYLWLGGHGCVTWETPPAAKFGVVRYNVTAGLRTLPEGACLTIPGAPAKVTSDASVKAIAVFATRAEAERFKSRL